MPEKAIKTGIFRRFMQERFSKDMFRVSFLILFNILIFSPLFCDEAVLEVRFSDPHALLNAKGKKIKIKGFLFEGEDGTKILSNEPNLRTCCAGALAKRDKQILVVGELKKFSPANVITLEGRLELNENDKETTPKHLLFLSIID